MAELKRGFYIFVMSDYALCPFGVELKDYVPLTSHYQELRASS